MAYKAIQLRLYPNREQETLLRGYSSVVVCLFSGEF
jgi:hypothetical protein